MKCERCSWCGKNITSTTGRISNGKYYHKVCLSSRNAAGKLARNEVEQVEDLTYEPVMLLERKIAADELLNSVNFNWKKAANDSCKRILAKYGNGMNR